ncbi:leucine-rich repeat-containing G-protein coupled receptor 4-like [Mya arenaria]|uniref:leucine-rich repeat-containing G-protein coupled receptor 4-like n=1 Tax=Mya arenaria TaxID=6604 RepID=UPI0022E82DD2|nr:leucine-rich repeat-containing G-protein coupled receptor 4-like [Mya arenaria]
MAHVLYYAVIALTVSTVMSSMCPKSMMSCDCRNDNKWSETNEDGLLLVDCFGDVDNLQDELNVYANKSIRKLLIENTTATHMTAEIFSDLKIGILTIKNQVTKIESDTFKPISDTLTSLRLLGVNISKSWKLDFLQDLNIESLYLDRNGLYPEHFPDFVFANFSLNSLKLLSLRHCKIVEIMEDAFLGLDGLETLDLTHNNIPKVAKWLLRLTNLKKINLSYNHRLIYIGDYAFKTLSKLEEIDLSHTGINAILEFAFVGLENSLQSLQLHHAELQHGHFSTMKKLRKLKRLDISYNQIVEMHNTSFIGFASLEELDISGQREIHLRTVETVNFVDSVFRGLERKLKVLKIRDLMMTSLPLAALSSLHSLQEIDASENEFTEIYEDFFYGVKARVIHLTNMQINEISPDAFIGFKLGAEVNFDNNEISNISFVLNTQRCQFRKLSFINNPISCDCDVVKIASTNRVSDLSGTCADGYFKRENLAHVHELPLAFNICDTTDYRNISNCKYMVSNSSQKSIIDSRLYCALLLLLLINFK